MDFKSGIGKLSNPKMKKLVIAIDTAQKIYNGMPRAEGNFKRPSSTKIAQLAEQMEKQNKKHSNQLKVVHCSCMSLG